MGYSFVMAIVMDGRLVSKKIKENVSAEAVRLRGKGIDPTLVVFLVGEDPASLSYVTGKERAAAEVGIIAETRKLAANIQEKDLFVEIEEANNDPNIDGILIQLPLPNHINELKATLSVLPEKDVDGFHPSNIGKMFLEEETPLPCTPHGVLELLSHYNIKTKGKNIVIVGRSNIVGKPLANLLFQRSRGNATVTVCHTATENISELTQCADILIAAAGVPGMITGDMVKEGSCIIDVGVNRIPDQSKKNGYRLAGDVVFDQVEPRAGWITPVPGGVGPMTIAMLLYNTVEAARKRRE